MTRHEIRAGHCYRIRKADATERRVLVDWDCPAGDPQWFCCWDIDSGAMLSLLAEDFVSPCDDQVTWQELVQVGPEHRA